MPCPPGAETPELGAWHLLAHSGGTGACGGRDHVGSWLSFQVLRMLSRESGPLESRLVEGRGGIQVLGLARAGSRSQAVGRCSGITGELELQPAPAVPGRSSQLLREASTLPRE